MTINCCGFIGSIDEFKDDIKMTFVNEQSVLDGQIVARGVEKTTKKIKEKGIQDDETKTQDVKNQAESGGLKKEKDEKLHKNMEARGKYKAKPLQKMSEGMKTLTRKEIKSKADKSEKNAKNKGKKDSKDIGRQIVITNKFRTFATKSSIVNENEERTPTENWVIKVTNGAKYKTEKAQLKSINNTKRKFEKAPTISSSNISTPTKQTLKPTTIQETPQITTERSTSKGTPSSKPTAEAASTASSQNDAENSGSGLRSVDSELENREKNGNTTVQKKENEMKKAERKYDMKLVISNIPNKNTLQTKNEKNEDNTSGDDNNEERDGIIENENKKEPEIEKKILCVGDSITEGYYNGGTAFHPYTKKLSELLNAERNDVTYTVYNEGKSGEFVNPDMIKRMPLLMDKYKPLNLVIIIGGTNDCTKKKCNVQNLFDGIKTLHEIAHKDGVKTVAVTIPDSNAPMLPGRNEKEDVWEGVNDNIRDFANGNEKVILCDLAGELPYRTMNDDERKLFWDDNLHYTPMGYDKMAEIIYDVIQGNF